MSAVAPPTSGGWFSLQSFRSARAIAWQQLKATQTLRYLVIGGIVALQWAMPVMFEPHNSYEAAMGGAFLLILAFALIAPSLILAAECESRTRLRRLMLPTTWWATSATLVCLGLGSLILFAAVAAANWLLVTSTFAIQAVALPFDNWLKHPAGSLAGSLVFGALFVLMAFAFGILGATMGRKMRTAIGISVGLFILLTNVAILGNWTGDDFIGLTAFVAPPLIVFDVWGLRHWFYASENAVFSMPALVNTRCPEKLVTSRPRSRFWHDVKLLVWHESKTTRIWWLGASVTVVATAATASGGAALMIVMALSAILGAMSFRSEQTESRYRFLGHRGISASAVWLSRHMVWVPRTVISMVLGIGVLWWTSRADFVYYLRDVRGAIIAGSAALYALGQVCSACCRRLHVALTLSLVFAVLFVVWWRLMVDIMKVPAAISMASVVPGLMLVSWRQCHDWLDERPGIRRPLWGVMASLAVTYCCVGVFRATEIPSEYLNKQFGFHYRPERLEPKPLVRSETAKQNANKLLAIGQDLAKDGAGAFRFWRLDRSPADWIRLNEPMRDWARRNANRVPRTLVVLDNADFYFAPIQPGDVFDRYAPLLLLELHGTKAESEGDHRRAAELYFAAIRGYWKTISSDRPGPDSLLAYAAAGHICRRVGRMSARLATAGVGDGGDQFIAELERVVATRPTLHDVNTWNRDVCLDLVRRPTQQGPLRIAYPSGSDGRRARLANFVSWHEYGGGMVDLFTFGLRDRRLIHWMRSRHAAPIDHYVAPLAGVERPAEAINRLEQLWLLDERAGHFAATTPTSTDYWAKFDVVSCLYAEFDLQTDLAAARQLMSIGYQAGGASSDGVSAAPRRKFQLGIDPWSGEPFVLQSARRGECKDAWGEPIPEGTIVLKSHGSIPKQISEQSDYDPDMLIGGPRYYVPPAGLQKLLQRPNTEE